MICEWMVERGVREMEERQMSQRATEIGTRAIITHILKRLNAERKNIYIVYEKRHGDET